MATQGIVSIIYNGKMLFKVVAGSDGYNAPKLVDWAKAYDGVMAAEVFYKAAIQVGFGHKTDLVVQASDGSLIFSDELSYEDFGGLYRDYSKFLDPRFNPRWEIGTADHVAIVVISEEQKANPHGFIGRFVTARLIDGEDCEARQGVCTHQAGETLIVMGETGRVYECCLPANIIPLDELWGSTRDFAIQIGVQE